ncbi:hypothetical protein KPH14_009044 [Odynerus spinipes]|uniref:PB1 domain-containing protein n=1 Tax=Odynerus spinipes TaxID=1348599 RepID=A0AAD9RNI9_9HYME|nr:hypothetical protein KPH14_009044 [Odynerus spinipes]
MAAFWDQMTTRLAVLSCLELQYLRDLPWCLCSSIIVPVKKRENGKGQRLHARMPATMENDDIRVKVIYNGEVQITYITAGISVDTLREEMRAICGFGGAGPASGPDQFTMKWVDDEGDPCRIASQQELDEALRLYELEKDTEITIHGQYQLSLINIFKSMRGIIFFSTSIL